MPKTRGKIQSTKKDRTGIKINDEWYTSFRPIQAEWKDEVEVEWVQNGNYKNIKSVTIITKKTDPSKGGQSPDWSYRESYAKDILCSLVAAKKDNDIDVLELSNLAVQCERILHDGINIKEKPLPPTQNNEEEGAYY